MSEKDIIRSIAVTVFLGGTCNNSTWRDKLIPLLTVDYFNPIVNEWTKECLEKQFLITRNGGKNEN